jgi:hypothetical protein
LDSSYSERGIKTISPISNKPKNDDITAKMTSLCFTSVNDGAFTKSIATMLEVTTSVEEYALVFDCCPVKCLRSARKPHLHVVLKGLKSTTAQLSSTSYFVDEPLGLEVHCGAVS